MSRRMRREAIKANFHFENHEWIKNFLFYCNFYHYESKRSWHINTSYEQLFAIKIPKTFNKFIWSSVVRLKTQRDECRNGIKLCTNATKIHAIDIAALTFLAFFFAPPRAQTIERLRGKFLFTTHKIIKHLAEK